MKKNNPLSGKVSFDEKGNLYFKKGLLFCGQITPKITPREWFYLLILSAIENGDKPENLEHIMRSNIGSKAIQLITKKSLKNKGYL